MGSGARGRPKFLAKKLRRIRVVLGLSQTEIGERLGLEKPFARNYVSGYERGTREPTLEILLNYARLVHISTDVLIDDHMTIPSDTSLLGNVSKKTHRE
jgi:transcriptional regulator with XRE-family HTH domain